MHLSVAEREFFRKAVKNFIVKNPSSTKSDIVKHFVQEGYAQSTVYDTLNKLTTSSPIKDKTRTGRPSSWTAAKKTKLKRLTNNRKGVSQQKLANKFNVTQQDISYQLSKMKIECRKREKTPKYSEQQQKIARKRSRKLVNLLYRENPLIIMDDEKYFTFTNDNLPANARYYTMDKDTCPDNVRFKGQDKYPVKVLVWIAISERGMAKSFVRLHKSAAINRKLYIDECLEKRLLPFIHKHHSDLNYLFWPDLASAHYSRDSTAWMNEYVNYVAKEDNPPNVPQARPIENFWACLSQKVYDNGWEAKTQQQLIDRILLKLKDFDLNFLQTLMSGIKTKLRSIADKGVFNYLK